MCELMAMSANVPTDICFSFTGLVRRGGETGPHKDGFGICFYEHGGIREFKDYQPSCQSPIAAFLQEYPIQSKNVISHIRQANVGQVNLQNTHPFQREMWGRAWCFAHNGQMPIDDVPKPSFFEPIGTTDSEQIFCWLLSCVRERFTKESTLEHIVPFISSLCQQLNAKGVSNILLSDGNGLFVFCSTKLNWITRKAPFGKAHLCDEDITIDFSAVTTEKDIVTVIATAPLTDNESWQVMKSGEGRLFSDGESVWSEFGPEIMHKKPTKSVD